MSYCDVYIGSLEDPGFSWEGGNWEGNCPHRLSPFFPPVGPAYGAFSVVIERIRQGVYDGKQVDWGGFVARVTRFEIEKLIEELYTNQQIYGPDSTLPHLKKQLEELKAYVRRLSTTAKYALVASEL